MRDILTKLLIGILIAAPLTLAAENNFVGTWKLNLEKSKFNPGPPPRAQIIVVESTERGMKGTATGESADGTPMNTSFTAKYDGKDYPVTDATTGTPAGHHTRSGFDSIAIKQVDANTQTFTTKKDGKVVSRGQAKVSGNILTIISKGTNAEGKPFNDTEVYDKR